MGSFCKQVSEEAKGLIAGISDRAIWFHLLIEAAEKQNVDIEKLTDEAIFTYGVNLYQDKVANNAREFVELMTEEGPGREAFKQEVVKADENESIAYFHSCPLVAAWKKYGLSDERIHYLCDLASKGDFGRVSNFPNINIEFPKKIGYGDDYCELVATIKEK
ncbi:MAG: L-2-amino-thiazoline-4-carboxylic acid hydrolase [Candidatus Cellulosilyticum pullistercoris]|uniref:L-2-amino-thiazoline-4-carboxylic acid hydrolase n=1 Tax=Candidatus Cellulosilyticum pullistercoris TaxID=2838521 RepID=A0A9E2KCP5_9FIRM|nr:L-2-amino-thiazoline-4-carboxylic acid hydrolase [Candidatus Cellulosilyticum pullistercoris]